MTLPQIEIVPLRGAVRSDSPSTLDVLLRITPPVPKTPLQRPALNLGLVLDRSGSMAGHKKMDYAREAAIYAVQQLAPTDRISVTIFDNVVETIAPNAPADNKNLIANALRLVEPRGGTNLCDGWKEGAEQVKGHVLATGLNRVLLLSDGQANEGETNPDVIASKVNGMARKNVSTSTLGVGDDYNEDLMEAMARSGDGNYYYIESPSQLPTIFQTELLGLMAAFGNTVSLGIEPRSGIEVSDLVNDLDALPTGRWKLPNLIVGMPVTVALRLKVEPYLTEREICKFRLAWNSPEDSKRHSFTVALRMPAVKETEWNALPINADVQEYFALLLIARDKKKATELLEQGDRIGTAELMKKMRECIAACPPSPAMAAEADEMIILDAQLAGGEDEKFRKAGKFQAYQRRQSKTNPV